VSAGHLVHEEIELYPNPVAYIPDGQFSQVFSKIAPKAEEYVPGLQSWQVELVLDPSNEENLPPKHKVHELIDEAPIEVE